jgi:hypothetical protein
VLSGKLSSGGVVVEVVVFGVVVLVTSLVGPAEVVPVVVTGADGVVVSEVDGAVVVVVDSEVVVVVVSGVVVSVSCASATGAAAKVASAAAETTPATRFSVLPTMTPNGG